MLHPFYFLKLVIRLAMKVSDDLISKLIGITGLMEGHGDIGESLHEITAMAAKILNVNNCSIMLLKEDETTGEFRLRIFSSYGYLPEEAYKEVVKLNEGIAGHVAATGQPLLIDDIENSDFASMARHKSKGKGFISAPISIGNKVIGIINAHNPKDGYPFKQEDLNLVSLISLFIGKSIQVIQLQKLLESRYALLAMAREAKIQISDITASGCDMDKLSKVLAKTFYKEMTKAGFSIDQIINAATEILSLLHEKLKSYRERRGRTQK